LYNSKLDSTLGGNLDHTRKNTQGFVNLLSDKMHKIFNKLTVTQVTQ